MSSCYVTISSLVTVPLMLACFRWYGRTAIRHPMGKLVGDNKFVTVVRQDACWFGGCSSVTMRLERCHGMLMVLAAVRVRSRRWKNCWGGGKHIRSLTPMCRVRCAFPIQITQSGGRLIPFYIAGPILCQMGRRHYQHKGTAVFHMQWFFLFEHFWCMTANFLVDEVFIDSWHVSEDQDVQFLLLKFKSLSKGCHEEQE